MLLQALEEQLLHVGRVCELLGVGGVCGHAEAQLLFLAPGGGVEGQDVLPAKSLRQQGLDLLHVLDLRAAQPNKVQGSTANQQQEVWGLGVGKLLVLERNGNGGGGGGGKTQTHTYTYLEVTATEVLHRHPHVVVGGSPATRLDHWQCHVEGTCAVDQQHITRRQSY